MAGPPVVRSMTRTGNGNGSGSGIGIETGRRRVVVVVMIRNRGGIVSIGETWRRRIASGGGGRGRSG
jgi:hypothetical protein